VVELGDGAVDLADAAGLLLRGMGDLADDVVDAAHAVDDLVHRAARLADQARAAFDTLDAGADQHLDLARRLGAALGQRAHLAGHHGKAAALLAGARGLHRGVERQDVGLEGDAVDGADDVADLAAAGLDLLHRRHHLLHHAAAALGDAGGAARQLAGDGGVVGRAARAAGQLLHRAGGLLQAAGALLGAHRQVVGARGDLGRRRLDGLHRAAHLADGGLQLALHGVQRGQRLADLVAAVHRHRGEQVAVGNALRGRHGRQQAAAHAAHHHAGERDAEHHRHRPGSDHADQRVAARGLHAGQHLGAPGFRQLRQLVQRAEPLPLHGGQLGGQQLGRHLRLHGARQRQRLLEDRRGLGVGGVGLGQRRLLALVGAQRQQLLAQLAVLLGQLADTLDVALHRVDVGGQRDVAHGVHARDDGQPHARRGIALHGAHRYQLGDALLDTLQAQHAGGDDRQQADQHHADGQADARTDG
jgi:hypothetical protein